MSTTITISDRVTPWLAEIGRGLHDPLALNRAASEGALPVVQQNFRALAASNKNPFGARGGFWNRMLAGTKADATQEAGFIRMPREVALRYFGGTVKPQTRKLLAIPARGEAYGKSPRQFYDLHFVKFRSGAMALVQNEQTQLARVKSGKKKGQIRRDKSREAGGGVFYWLSESATVRGDSGVLPPDQEIAAGAMRGVRTYVDVLAGRAAR